MKKHADRQDAYIRKVQEDTRRYVQDLLAQNEKLGLMVVSLEAEKLRLQERMSALREELEGYREDRLNLQRELAEIESEKRRSAARYTEVERQNANLANLYVASYRLHSTLDRQEVLDGIQEIVINLVGSEEIAVLEVNPERTALSLVASFGIDPEAFRAIPMGSGLIGRVAQSGKTYTAESRKEDALSPGEDELTACVPLVLDGRVNGVIAIFRLLPQKAGLEPVDHELFDLLATHAATALYCTSLQARAGVN